MALFGKKKEKTVDLGERYKKQQELASRIGGNSQPQVPSLPETPAALNPNQDSGSDYKEIPYSQQGGQSSSGMQSATPQPAQEPQQSHADSVGLNFMDNPALHQNTQSSYGYASPQQNQSSYPPRQYPPLSNQSPMDSESPEDKRKKLTKRLMDITKQLEELSNQLYHLQQRVESLEKRTGSNQQGGQGYSY